MRILRVEPGKTPFVKDIEDNLKSYQAEVEGYIEIHHLTNDVLIVCNEEAKIKGMKPNRRFTVKDIICGPFFIVGDDHEGNFRSLTDEEVEFSTQVFGEIEEFADYEPDAQPRMEFYTF